MELAKGLTLPGGAALSWETIQPGRYPLVDPLPQQKWSALFARVSSDAQRDGRSLPQQVDDAIRRANRDQRSIVAAYLDPALSATKLSFGQRPGITRLLEDIRAGKIETLYVYKRDRVSRQELEWLQFLKTCAINHVDIRFTAPDEPPFGKGAYAQFQEHIIIAAAALEANLIRMRVKDNVQSRARNGEWLGGSLPYGLMRDKDNKIVEEPTQAQVIKEIFKLASDEMLGAVKIADGINNMFPGSRYGGHWTKHAVEKVLKNRIYSGVLVYNMTEDGTTRQVEVPSKHFPELIPDEVFLKVTAMRRDRGRSAGSGPSRSLSSSNLLTGVLRCGVCGRKMIGNHNVRRYERQDGQVSEYHTRYYACRYGRDRMGCAYRSTIRQHLLDDTVLEAVNGVVAETSVEGLISKVHEFRDAQVEEIRARLGGARKSVGQIETAVSRNQVGLETCQPEQVQYYHRRIAELLQQQSVQIDAVQNLERELASASEFAIGADQVVEALRDWPQRFGAAPKEQRRALIGEVVDKVVWNPDSRTVDLVFRFDPSGRFFCAPFVMQNATEGFPEVAFCVTANVIHPDAARRRIQPPLGFLRVKDEYVPDPEYAPVITKVYQLRGEGFTWTQILETIRLEFPHLSKIRGWTPSSLADRSRNCRYCGYEPCKAGQARTGRLDDCKPSIIFPPLVSQEEWCRAHRIPIPIRL